MASRSISSYRNRLLKELSGADLKLLRPHLTPVALAVHHDLEKPHEPIEYVYFIESGFASVVAVVKRKPVEVGLIGPEGMSGSAIVLGDHRSPHSTYIQGAGDAQRIGVSDLRNAMDRSPPLRAFLLKFVEVFMIQTAHTAIANARAKIERRLARWLLMAHDRLDGDHLPLTHEFLSLMLGVRRAGVTEALHALERRRLIKSLQGQITVLNRKRLENVAGDIYGVPEAEYRRLIG